MGFSRREPDDDLQWNKIRARLEENGASPGAATLFDGLPSPPAGDLDEDDDDDDEEVEAEESGEADGADPRPTRTRPAARALQPLDSSVDASLAAERLPAIKRAASRMRRLKKSAIDPAKAYKVGQKVFDPTVQRFGTVVFATEAYVRIALSDGSESAHGKPPLEDRRAFVFANFDRMDNKTMAEILGISVHTMRRLCHEYGLRRQGTKKAARSA